MENQANLKSREEIIESENYRLESKIWFSNANDFIAAGKKAKARKSLKFDKLTCYSYYDKDWFYETGVDIGNITYEY